ncbi:MAG: hypothetical protein ACLT98_09165 [Eggerthellaceae bacterium]
MATESSLGREGEVASGAPMTIGNTSPFFRWKGRFASRFALTLRLRDYESFLPPADCSGASCDDILAFEGDALERGYAPSSRSVTFRP